MGYQLSFSQIWRNFDKLTNGVILSIELAVIAILIGAVIGLVLAVVYVSAGRVVRSIISACARCSSRSFPARGLIAMITRSTNPRDATAISDPPAKTTRARTGRADARQAGQARL